MVKLAIAIGTALLVSAAAQATDWRMFMPVGHAPDRHAWFIDRSSVQTVNGNKRAWFKMINEHLGEKGISSMKTLVDLDCKGNRSRFIAIEMFGPKGLLGNNETPGEWSYTAPDSPIQALSRTVCTGNYNDTIASEASSEITAQAAFDVVNDKGEVKRHR